MLNLAAPGSQKGPNGLHKSDEQLTWEAWCICQFAASGAESLIPLKCCEQVLTSWQTHGAKLEAVRAEFQTDPQNIRDVLRVWQLHGDRINSFLENDGVEANGGSGRLPSPSSRALNGKPSAGTTPLSMTAFAVMLDPVQLTPLKCTEEWAAAVPSTWQGCQDR